VTESSAGVEGPEWSARAEAWAELWPDLAAPARAAVAAAARVGPGMRVLDIGCGSGEFCALAAERGATAAGLDAAPGMIAIARRHLPDADLRVGPMEQLPWTDASFDVVTAFNALQFAADYAVALAEAARVTRPGGDVAVCGWGPPEERELLAVFRAVAALEPAEEDDDAPPGPPTVEERMRAAGLRPRAAAAVAAPYTAPDLATLERAVLDGAGFGTAVARAGAPAVRRALKDAAAPFRRPDGSYRFENRFRYVIGER
jgi:SAM-dependent methyltransferase